MRRSGEPVYFGIFIKFRLENLWTFSYQSRHCPALCGTWQSLKTGNQSSCSANSPMIWIHFNISRGCIQIIKNNFNVTAVQVDTPKYLYIIWTKPWVWGKLFDEQNLIGSRVHLQSRHWEYLCRCKQVFPRDPATGNACDWLINFIDDRTWHTFWLQCTYARAVIAICFIACSLSIKSFLPRVNRKPGSLSLNITMSRNCLKYTCTKLWFYLTVEQFHLS